MFALPCPQVATAPHCGLERPKTRSHLCKPTACLPSQMCLSRTQVHCTVPIKISNYPLSIFFLDPPLAVSKQLHEWCDEYYREAERAIRGFGRYPLSEEYKEIFRSPTIWNQMSALNQKELVQKFYEFVPGSTN